MRICDVMNECGWIQKKKPDCFSCGIKVATMFIVTVKRQLLNVSV